MTILQTIIFGIIEGITEFLPISSTAHLDITRFLLSIPATDFVKSFVIAIQLGAILAVVVLYRKKIFSSWIYLRNIIIAFIPTGIIGFILYKLIKSFLLGNLPIETWALLLGGVIILFYEHKVKNKAEDELPKTIESLGVKELLLLGTAQAISVIPGVSRSGAVIVSGRMLGLSRMLITEFSFLLAIPTILIATVYDLYKSGFAFTGDNWGMIGLGFVVSFIVAMLVVKWLLGYIKKHSFSIFGWYRVIIGILLLVSSLFL